jgi:hypothetical protein
MNKTPKEFALQFAADTRRMVNLKNRFAIVINLKRQLEALRLQK